MEFNHWGWEQKQGKVITPNIENLQEIKIIAKVRDQQRGGA
jgi:hypothetical protein